MTVAPASPFATVILMRHSLGKVVATAAVAASVPEAVIVGLLDRHVALDWGDPVSYTHLTLPTKA